MLNFTFTDTLSARLQAGIKAVVDFTPAMRTIADILRTQTAERFETEVGPDGLRWRPSQRALESGGLTLTDRGHLRLSITAANDATSATIGTNLIYAAIHQFGGKITPKAGKALNTPFGPRGSVDMPARPFVGFGPGDVLEIEAVLDAYLARALGSGGDLRRGAA